MRRGKMLQQRVHDLPADRVAVGGRFCIGNELRPNPGGEHCIGFEIGWDF